MTAQWIPNINSFFDSLVRDIRGARTHLSTDQVDSAEFWCRRLDEYERTLRLLLARVEESLYSQTPTPQSALHKMTACLRCYMKYFTHKIIQHIIRNVMKVITNGHFKFCSSSP